MNYDGQIVKTELMCLRAMNSYLRGVARMAIWISDLNDHVKVAPLFDRYGSNMVFGCM